MTSTGGDRGVYPYHDLQICHSIRCFFFGDLWLQLIFLNNSYPNMQRHAAIKCVLSVDLWNMTVLISWWHMWQMTKVGCGPIIWSLEPDGGIGPKIMGDP